MSLEDKELSLHLLVRSLGLTGNCAGYKYLICTLELLREEPERLELVTKRVYPEVARRFGTTPSTVEGALRTAVKVCAGRAGDILPPRAPEGGPLTVKAFLRWLMELDRREK